MPTTNNRKSAFTIIELVVAMAISSILIFVTIATYQLYRKTVAVDQSLVDLTQNARIVLDRFSREMRQTQAVVTTIPSSPSDTTTPQPNQIEFENGNTNDLTYEHYYISGTTLDLDTVQYYFSYDPTTRVVWNAVGTGGVAPIMNVMSTQAVADDIQSIKFYGTDTIEIVITTSDGTNTETMRTTILGRNTPLGINP